MPFTGSTAGGPLDDASESFHDCEPFYQPFYDTDFDMGTETKYISQGQQSSGKKTANASHKHVEYAIPFDSVKLSWGQKAKKHFRRFWCCYVLGSVILLAILLPVFFLVILPAIIKLLISKASLPIYGGAFLANSPTTAIVSIDTALSIPAGISAILDPVTLYIYNKKTSAFSPFLGLDVNQTHLKGHTALNVSDSLVTVLNQTEMESWFQNVVKDAKTALSVRGSTRVHIGALNYPITIDKTEHIATLNNLAGFGFSGLELVLPADADGTNFMGNFTLPNWSPLTIGLGNVSLNVLSGSILVGAVHIQDVVAPPGNTTMSFRGEVFLDQILKNVGSIIQSQIAALKDGNLNISASGNSTIVNGQHIGYVENVLNNQLLSTQVSILELVTQLAGSLLSGNETLEDLGSLLGGWLGNLTGLTTGESSSANVASSLAGILRGSLNTANLLSLMSNIIGHGASTLEGNKSVTITSTLR